MKKFLAMLLAVLMLVTMMPVLAMASSEGELETQEQQDAFGRYGSKIGWNYAIISNNGIGWTAQRPTAANDLSSHVKVNDWVKGQATYALTNDASKIVTVTCDPG